MIYSLKQKLRVKFVDMKCATSKLEKYEMMVRIIFDIGFDLIRISDSTYRKLVVPRFFLFFYFFIFYFYEFLYEFIFHLI